MQGTKGKTHHTGPRKSHENQRMGKAAAAVPFPVEAVKEKQKAKTKHKTACRCFYSTFRVKIYCLSLTQRKGALLICTKHYYVSISRFKGHPRDSKGRKQDGLSDSWCFSESSEAEVIITGRCGRRIKKFNYGRDRERRQLFREVLF